VRKSVRALGRKEFTVIAKLAFSNEIRRKNSLFFAIDFRLIALDLKTS